jgi:hypothetical protein
MQYSALFPAKKTSRQQAVTPRFGGRALNDFVEDDATFEIVRKVEGCAGCDCKRTRTTSRGVTDVESEVEIMTDQKI